LAEQAADVDVIITKVLIPGLRLLVYAAFTYQCMRP
jgi:NAD/NADP transhydrogenase alpha subunit